MYYEKFLTQKLDFGQSIKVLLNEIKTLYSTTCNTAYTAHKNLHHSL